MMRGLFLSLLLLNAAYLGWLLYQEKSGGRMSVAAAQRAVDKGSLVLLNEYREPLHQRRGYKGKTQEETGEQERVVDEQPEDKPAQLPQTKQGCFRIEGLKKENEARKLFGALSARGVGALKTGSEQQEERRYWVKLTGGRSKKQTANVLKRLKRAGLRDFYLIQGADVGNTISLGVFSNKEAAEQRYQAVRHLEYEPTIDEIRLPVRRWWLNTGEAQQELLEEMLQSLAIREAHINTHPCP